jgi:hypothetical protein
MNDLQTSQGPDTMVAIARDLAMDMHELDQILVRHGMTMPEFTKMRADPRFEMVLGECLREWNGAKNTEQRVKVKAAISLEESLLNMHQAMNDPKEPLNHRMEVAKFLAKVAGIGEATQQAAGPGFSITINMGESQPRVVTARPIQTIEN